jgi:pimeloyl-ACP methyl ester carboxylesterase
MPTLNVRDIELYYEEHGSGEPLLCIMGFATDSTGWLLQVPAFAERHRTIVFDNRGVGRSSKPTGAYTIHEMADDAVALLDHLKIDRAHVLGLSMGGMIAQELVLRHPERPRPCSRDLPEPDAETESQRTFSSRRWRDDHRRRRDEDRLHRHEPVHVLSAAARLSQRELHPDGARSSWSLSGALQYGFSIEAIMGQMQAIMAHKATDRLGTIAAPTLVLVGDADRLISPANSDVLAKTIPRAKLVRVPGGSHGFNIETPDVFNRAVLDFLATVRN